MTVAYEVEPAHSEESWRVIRRESIADNATVRTEVTRYKTEYIARLMAVALNSMAMREVSTW